MLKAKVLNPVGVGALTLLTSAPASKASLNALKVLTLVVWYCFVQLPFIEPEYHPLPDVPDAPMEEALPHFFPPEVWSHTAVIEHL